MLWTPGLIVFRFIHPNAARSWLTLELNLGIWKQFLRRQKQSLTVNVILLFLRFMTTGKLLVTHILYLLRNSKTMNFRPFQASHFAGQSILQVSLVRSRDSKTGSQIPITEHSKQATARENSLNPETGSNCVCFPLAYLSPALCILLKGCRGQQQEEGGFFLR
jgi:hypothetical protein